MIKNYIFDLVGVLADFGTKRIFQHFIELGAADVWELNNEMDLGYLSGEEFLQLVLERCKGVTVEELRSEYLEPMTLPVEHLQLLCQLRKEHRVYLLSNVGDMHWTHLVEEMAAKGYAVNDCFDATFPSFETHVNKPDLKAYQNVLLSAGLDPSETIFFDDSPANVEAAKKLGMHAELVKTTFPNPQLLQLGKILENSPRRVRDGLS